MREKAANPEASTINDLRKMAKDYLKYHYHSNYTTTTFSMCWSWKRFQCKPCSGEGKWSYLAGWCNGNYEGRKDNCCACWSNENCGFNKQGDEDCQY
ncbi:MAG: hypothetical protein NTX75_12470 [Proteobacteria bacterium]|nr:hypothetical protein [Pseudomonadota bacterium]